LSCQDAHVVLEEVAKQLLRLGVCGVLRTDRPLGVLIGNLEESHTLVERVLKESSFLLLQTAFHLLRCGSSGNAASRQILHGCGSLRVECLLLRCRNLPATRLCHKLLPLRSCFLPQTAKFLAHPACLLRRSTGLQERRNPPDGTIPERRFDKLTCLPSSTSERILNATSRWPRSGLLQIS